MQREAFRFRKQRRGSSGKTALIPQLSTLQGIFKYGKRKNLPTHGIIQRHSQRRPGTNVSLFHLWTPLGWGRIKLQVSLQQLLPHTWTVSALYHWDVKFKSLNTDESSASAGISTFSVREPGLSIGPQRRSVRLKSTDPPASAWRRCSSSIYSLDANSSHTQKSPFGLSLYFAPLYLCKTWTTARCDGSKLNCWLHPLKSMLQYDSCGPFWFCHNNCVKCTQDKQV